MERHDGALGVGALALHVGAPVARRLPLAVEGVDLGHPHAEGLLHSVTDLDLGGPGVDDEHVDAVVHERVALLGDHRADEHGHGVTHRSRPPRRSPPWRWARPRARRRPGPRARRPPWRPWWPWSPSRPCSPWSPPWPSWPRPRPRRAGPPP